MKRLVVVGAAADPVEGGIDEPEVAAGVLVGQGDDRGPQRSGGADPAAREEEVVLAAAGALVRAVLLVMFFAWAGRSPGTVFKLPSSSTLLAILAVAAAAS